VSFDSAPWTIPTKQKLTKRQERNAGPFVIPLPSLAVDLFRDLRELAGESPWAVASEEASGGHFTDKALGLALRRLFADKAPRLVLAGGDAHPHDLRRTMRTHLGRLRVPLHIVERCLNHSLGTSCTGLGLTRSIGTPAREPAAPLFPCRCTRSRTRSTVSGRSWSGNRSARCRTTTGGGELFVMDRRKRSPVVRPS
jgi:hypothetical protein